MLHVKEPYLWGQTYIKTEKKAEETLKSKKKKKNIREKRPGGVNMSVFPKKQSESEKGPPKDGLQRHTPATSITTQVLTTTILPYPIVFSRLESMTALIH